MESKVENENFIVVQGWMVNELNLKGSELLIYACIYGFSQTEGQVFNGSLRYLEDWTNSTKQGVLNCLKNLVEKGLIEKRENYFNGVKFVEYSVSKFTGGQKSLPGGDQKSLPNNIEEDKKEYLKENIKEKSVFDGYNFGVELKNAIDLWLNYKKEKKQTYKPIGLKVLLDKLSKDANEHGEQYVINAINSSMAKGYSGIFPDKSVKNTTPYIKNSPVSSQNFEHHDYTGVNLESFFRTPDEISLDEI